MADSFNKKEREKKRQKRRKDKAERKVQRKQEGKIGEEFMYVDENGNLSPTPPDPNKKKVEIKLEDINLSGGGLKTNPEDASPFRQGVVKFFNTEKGYGFIIDKISKDSVFVHADNLVDEIGDRDKVSFEMGQGPKGPIAVNVKRI